MTARELAKLIEIRDGLKNAFWGFDGWRWAAKFDQFIADVQHASAPEPDLLDASKRCIGLLETVEAKALVGDEGCLWAVEIMRAAITKAEGIDATGEQGFAVSGEGTPP